MSIACRRLGCCLSHPSKGCLRQTLSSAAFVKAVCGIFCRRSPYQRRISFTLPIHYRWWDACQGCHPHSPGICRPSSIKRPFYCCLLSCPHAFVLSWFYLWRGVYCRFLILYKCSYMHLYILKPAVLTSLQSFQCSLAMSPVSL